MHTTDPTDQTAATTVGVDESPSIVWFRDDLRLADHPALHAAVQRDHPVIALYVLDEESEGVRPLGGAAHWWLHGSLTALDASLRELGIPLVLRRGAAEPVVLELAASVHAGAVLWNRRYGGPERAVDTAIKTALTESGVQAHSYAGSLLFEPWTIKTGQGNHYSVFTPFWRACLAAEPPREPYPAPLSLTAPSTAVASDALSDWALLPTHPDWAQGLRDAWVPGEAAAHELLTDFLHDTIGRYATERDSPSSGATSRLSPHLRWGEISPFQVWHATQAVQRTATGAAAQSGARFLTEIGWREFAWHVLFHAPDLATVNLRRDFDTFPWPEIDQRALRAWQRGRTGFSLVDAGMRELWRTGSMHNRVRMVTASFLIKNLMIDWRQGEQWFWNTLVDADAASNPFGWQWVAGSGADAAPYFRVFNPELQSKKFDPQERYIRENIAEWGTNLYPAPIVDLGETRRAALAAYEHVKKPTPA